MKRIALLQATALGLLAAAPATLSAQGRLDSDLLALCQVAADGGSLAAADLPLCRDVVASMQLVQPELGLTLAGGNPVLGTASPLGTKFRAIPRVNLGGRMTFAWMSIPDILDYPELPDEPVGTVGMTATMPQIDISVGLFEGFDLATTLGGFAAIELLGSVGAMVLPSGAGFQNDVTGWGLGVRVGLLRESFTAPGVSISGFYKAMGRVQYGNVESGDDAQFGMDMSVASFRAGLSKSFVALGFALTLGWDRYSSDVDYGIAGPTGNLIPVAPENAPAQLVSSRWSAFVDVSYIVLFFSVVAEAGWQEGVKLTTSRGDEIESGNFFGTIGMRFTL
jgi:hypothetical protein